MIPTKSHPADSRTLTLEEVLEAYGVVDPLEVELLTAVLQRAADRHVGLQSSLRAIGAALAALNGACTAAAVPVVVEWTDEEVQVWVMGQYGKPSMDASQRPTWRWLTALGQKTLTHWGPDLWLLCGDGGGMFSANEIAQKLGMSKPSV